MKSQYSDYSNRKWRPGEVMKEKTTKSCNQKDSGEVMKEKTTKSCNQKDSSSKSGTGMRG